MISSIKNAFRIILISVSALWLFVACVPNRAPQIYKKYNTALVTIKLTGHNGQVYSQGSGIVLKDRGWVVTNFHVMEKPGNYLCEHQGQAYKLDSVIAFDAHKDIMVLRYSGQNPASLTRRISRVKTARKKKLVIGETVYAMGTPYGMENSITQGILSGIRFAGDSSRSYIQISAPFSQGSSGGAIFDHRSRLIGMSTMKMGGEAQNINFGIPTSDIIEAGEKRIRRGRENTNLPNDNTSCFDKGLEYLHQANFGKAKEEFRHSLRDAYMDRAQVYSMIGEVYRRLKETDSARYYFDRSWNERHDPQSRYLLGRLEFDLGNDHETLVLAEQALALEKNHVGGQLLKCWLLFRSGNIAASRTLTSALLRRYPYNCEVQATAAFYSLFAGKSDLAPIAQKMLSAGKKSCPLAEIYLATMHQKQGRKNEGEKLFRSAIRKDPTLDGGIFTQYYYGR